MLHTTGMLNWPASEIEVYIHHVIDVYITKCKTSWRGVTRYEALGHVPFGACACTLQFGSLYLHISGGQW